MPLAAGESAGGVRLRWRAGLVDCARGTLAQLPDGVSAEPGSAFLPRGFRRSNERRRGSNQCSRRKTSQSRPESRFHDVAPVTRQCSERTL